jgi:gentisate 1,2-dioxygenase
MDATHDVETEAVLFGYSDRAVQEKLDFCREEKNHD